MSSTISIVATPLPLDRELKQKSKLLLSTAQTKGHPPSSTVFSPPLTPTSPTSSTLSTETSTTSISSITLSPCKKRLSSTVNRAPFRKHNICNFVPDLLSCCGSNMRGGLSPMNGSGDGSRVGTPLPRFLGELIFALLYITLLLLPSGRIPV